MKKTPNSNTIYETNFLNTLNVVSKGYHHTFNELKEHNPKLLNQLSISCFELIANQLVFTKANRSALSKFDPEELASVCSMHFLQKLDKVVDVVKCTGDLIQALKYFTTLVNRKILDTFRQELRPHPIPIPDPIFYSEDDNIFIENNGLSQLEIEKETIEIFHEISSRILDNVKNTQAIIAFFLTYSLELKPREAEKLISKYGFYHMASFTVDKVCNRYHLDKQLFDSVLEDTKNIVSPNAAQLTKSAHLTKKALLKSHESQPLERPSFL